MAFEFRWRRGEQPSLVGQRLHWWLGLATFFQGSRSGRIDGIPVENRAYAGAALDWLTPFSILTGISLVIGYALLGATWLVLKDRKGGLARSVPIICAGICCLRCLPQSARFRSQTPFLDIPSNAQRWFTFPNVIFTAPVPIRGRGPSPVGVVARRSPTGWTPQPFVLTLARSVPALSYAGLGISMYPYIVPQSIDHLAGGGAPAEQPDLHAGRRRGADPADPRLYRVGLLGVPRQGETRERLSLMASEPTPRPLIQRLLWFAALWLAGVASVAIVSYGLRLWLAPR